MGVCEVIIKNNYLVLWLKLDVEDSWLATSSRRTNILFKIDCKICFKMDYLNQSW